MLNKCDPCVWCRNIYDDSDPSVGMYGYGCKASDEGYDDVFDQVKPCPHFIPIFSSYGLFDQLYAEEEEEFYKEME